MIVTAALAWFDEAPDDLDRYVRALPIVADRLVAVDGGYVKYPGATPSSPKEQAAAIRAAAFDIGLPIDIFTPDKVWAGQLEKRTFLYQRAAKDSTWIGTFDADHILHGVREPFRHELNRVRAERIEIPFYTTPNYDRPIKDTASTKWHAGMSGKTTPMALLLRAMPEMRVETYHWYVSGLKNNKRVWVGDVRRDRRYPVTRSHLLQAPVFVEHRCLYRRDRNILGNRVFCEDRVGIVAATGQEDAVAA